MATKTKKPAKVNKTLVKKWIKALRSGRYRQGFRALATGSGKSRAYCCLGVLCRVVKPRGFKSIRANNETINEFSFEGLNRSGALPDTLAKMVGVKRSLEARLISMNDNEGKDFNEIADHIEKHLLKKKNRSTEKA